MKLDVLERALVAISGQAVKISGETVIAKISGEAVSSRISGETVIAKISGETVTAKISGETVTTRISGEAVKISGETVIAKTSGDTHIAKVSGEAVKISGETVIAKISGETVTAKVSGEAVRISGEAVKISGQVVEIRLATGLVAGAKQITDDSGGTVLAASTAVYGVKIRSQPGNDDMWVGPAGVLSGTGLLLLGGETEEIAVDNLNVVYIIAAKSGEWVTYRGLTE